MRVLRTLQSNFNDSRGLKQKSGMPKRFKNTAVPDLHVSCDVGAISVA